jgi:hypothetical protein
MPGTARARIQAWCDSHETARIVTTERRYEALGTDDVPLIADDADVTVIAASTARFAADILSGQSTRFPYSAYAIGMEAGWIFGSPFDTFPIDLGSDGDWVDDSTAYSQEDLISFISELMPPKGTNA